MTCSFQEVEHLESVLVYPEEDMSFSCPAVPYGAGGHFSFSGGHPFALAQLSWQPLVTAGIEVDYIADKALVACAGFESHSQWANTCIIKASFDMSWHHWLWLRGQS